MKLTFLEILCIFAIVAIVIIVVIKKNKVNDSINQGSYGGSGKIENYIDPIWPNKVSMYNDYYTRSYGSIYGNSCRPWSMLDGFPSYPKAY